MTNPLMLVREGKPDNAGELLVPMTENDRMILRAMASWTIACYNTGVLQMNPEDVADLVEFNNRFSQFVEDNCHD